MTTWDRDLFRCSGRFVCWRRARRGLPIFGAVGRGREGCWVESRPVGQLRAPEGCCERLGSTQPTWCGRQAAHGATNDELTGTEQAASQTTKISMTGRHCLLTFGGTDSASQGKRSRQASRYLGRLRRGPASSVGSAHGRVRACRRGAGKFQGPLGN